MMLGLHLSHHVIVFTPAAAGKLAAAAHEGQALKTTDSESNSEFKDELVG